MTAELTAADRETLGDWWEDGGVDDADWGLDTLYPAVAAIVTAHTDTLRARLAAVEALDAKWCDSVSHGTERGEPWVPWLVAQVRQLREALATAVVDSECASCGESPRDECLQSKRPCGHHCNHSWEQDVCHWCGAEFGERDMDAPRCDTCSDAGLVAWMVEADPSCSQEPDGEGKVPCPDCAAIGGKP